MKKLIKLTVVLALGLLTLGIFSNSVLADQKSEEKAPKTEAIEKTIAPDQIADILKHYFAIRELLAQDRVEQVSTHAQKMSIQLGNLINALESIRVSASNLKADDLDEARKGFAPLSQAAIDYVKRFGFSGDAYTFHCSMMKESWLQEHHRIGNPYYGSKMYKCGEMTGMTKNGKYMEKTQGKSDSRTYEVFGMNCPGCHGAIEKLVKKIPVVQQAEANWKEQRLVVTLRPGGEVNDEAVYDAIRRANFTPGKRIK